MTATFIAAPGPEMTPHQVRELQQAFNEACGDLAWRHRMIVLPPGSQVIKPRNRVCSYCNSLAGTGSCRVCGAPE